MGLVYLAGALAYATGSFGGAALTERIGRRAVLGHRRPHPRPGRRWSGPRPELGAVHRGGDGRGCRRGQPGRWRERPRPRRVPRGPRPGDEPPPRDVQCRSDGGARHGRSTRRGRGAVGGGRHHDRRTRVPPRRRLLASCRCPPVVRRESWPAPATTSRRPAPTDGVGIRRLLAGPLLLLGIAIATYVGSEVGVSSWLVRFLEPAPLTTATLALSLYWGGLAVGRLISSAIADRFDHLRFTIVSTVAMGVLIGVAVLAPSLESLDRGIRPRRRRIRPGLPDDRGHRRRALPGAIGRGRRLA